MARTTIEFEYKGTEYTLCLTIGELKRLERNGFSFGDIGNHVLTASEDLFCAAFNAYHKDTPRKVRETIFKELSDSEDIDGEEGASLSDVLFKMANEVIASMAPSGNVKWKVNRE